MVSATSAALAKTRSVVATAESFVLQRKASVLSGLTDMGGSTGMNQLNQFRDQSQNRERYALYRGHVYSAINALAQEAGKQPAHVGRKKSKTDKDKKPKDKKSTSTEHIRRKMPTTLRTKAAATELEIAEDHPLTKNLERPNKLQTRSVFVQSFVANLCLTGWAFVVAGEKPNKKGYEFYSVPTTWVHPVHDKGAFAEFKIYDPSDPNADRTTTIPGNQVGFAHFPKPSDPLGAVAPAAAQSEAIKIDSYIQSSQKIFFENGVFPSVIVTVGANPHPDVPGGIRPRLTAPQRRQVNAAIKKVSGGIANYGNPAIVDGLIEKIERLSATQNEMGWEKSEKAVRSRILAAFGVHPFMLGDEVAGSYAQSYNVKEIFYGRVNTFLDMLSVVMTGFTDSEEGFIKEADDLIIWWDECKASDPSMEKAMWEAARQRDDVTQNEFRAWMGLPPDEDDEEAIINKTIIQHVHKIAADTKAGTITVEQSVAMLKGLGLPSDIAEEIAGEGPTEEDLAAQQQAMMGGVPGQPGQPGQQPPGAPGQPPQAGQKPGAKPPKKKPPTPEEALESATAELKNAISVLKDEPRRVLQDLVERSSLIDDKAFCPTGEGGGIDTSCGSGSGSGDSKKPPRASDKPVADKPKKPPKQDKPESSAPSGSGSDKKIGEFKKLSAANAEKELSKSANQWSEGNDYFANRAVKAYAGTSDSFLINNCLRTNCGDKNWKDKAEALGKVLEKTSFPMDVQAHRAINPKDDVDRQKILEHFKSNQGQTFVDSAFVSTTANKKYADDWSKKMGKNEPIKVMVLVPQGAKAAYMPKDIVGRQEWEVMIQKGSKFKVRSVEGNDVVLELLK